MPLLLGKVAAMTSFREDTQTAMRIMTMRMVTMKMKTGIKMATCFVLVFNGGVRVAGQGETLVDDAEITGEWASQVQAYTSYQVT